VSTSISGAVAGETKGEDIGTVRKVRK